MSKLRLMGVSGNTDTNWSFQLIPSSTVSDLKGISQSNNNVSFACGTNGAVFTLNINGNSHSVNVLDVNTNVDLTSVGFYGGNSFLDSITTIVAGNSGVVQGIGNNGAITALSTPGNGIKGCNQSGNNDPYSHFIVGTGGYYAHRNYSPNAGVTFTTLTSGTTNTLNAVACNAGTGYKPFVVGAGGYIGMNGGYLTNNFNVNQTPASGTTNALFAIGSASAGNGGANEVLVAVGAAGVITSSLDSGFTWTVRNSQTVATLRGVCGPKSGTNNPWVVVGDDGTVIVSSDAINWSLLDTVGIGINLNAIARGMNNDYIIVGDNGTIYRMY